VDQSDHRSGAYAVSIEDEHITVKALLWPLWKEAMEMEYDPSYN